MSNPRRRRLLRLEKLNNQPLKVKKTEAAAEEEVEIVEISLEEEIEKEEKTGMATYFIEPFSEDFEDGGETEQSEELEEPKKLQKKFKKRTFLKKTAYK